MGYLLPVHFTQYQEYQNRIKPVKSNYSQTARIDRVKRVYLSQPKNRGIQTTKYTKQQDIDTNKLYADLTGIGGNFDEKI